MWTALIVCSALIQGAADRGTPRQQLPPKYSVRVVLASFDVEVLDPGGQPVLGLAREDFEVREDGKVEEITHFAWLSNRPVSLAIVLDTTTLASDRVSRAKEIILRLAHLVARDDEIALLSFDARDAYVEHDFTRERPLLMEALDNIGVPKRRRGAVLKQLFGATPRAGLAVDLALERMKRSHNEKKALLLVSNGFAGLGPGTTDHVAQSGATLLTLSFGTSRTGAVLSLGADGISKRDLTTRSGGRDFNALAEDVGATCRAIAFALKNHYSLGYRTRAEPERDKPRRIEITLPGKPYTVHARRSYAP